MNATRHKATPLIVCVVLLFLIALSLFAYTVELRRPWFGTTGAIESWFSSGTLMFAKNWYREGILHLKFALYQYPRSVEFPTLESRNVYTSYPPGSVIPIYLIGKLLGHEPTLATVMNYNLLNHFLIAFLLALTILVLARQFRYNDFDAPVSYFDAFILALIPILLELLTPAPIYHHIMGYFGDQAVMLLFAAYVFLEVLRDSVSERTRRLLSFVQALIAFAGVLTDYLFVFVALCVYLKRLARGEIGKRPGAFLTKSISFWFSFALGGILFVIQLAYLNGFENINMKFRQQTGMARGKFLALSTDNFFWTRHMVRGYGETGVFLIWASLILFLAVACYLILRFLARKKTNPMTARILAVAFMLMMPGFCHAFFLRAYNSNPIHYFSALRFSMMFATVPFVLIPLLVLSCINAEGMWLSPARIRAWVRRCPLQRAPRWPAGTSPPEWSLTPLLLLALAGLQVHAQYPKILPQFKAVIPSANQPATADFIAANTGYKDVLFTWDATFEQDESFLWMAYSMKRVYFAGSVKEIYEQLKDIHEEYVVNHCCPVV